jgi:hypothetical protein
MDVKTFESSASRMREDAKDWPEYCIPEMPRNVMVPL